MTRPDAPVTVRFSPGNNGWDEPDPDDFDAFYARHHGELIQALVRRGAAMADAEDVAAAAFLAIMRIMPKREWNAVESKKGYLFRVALNEYWRFAADRERRRMLFSADVLQPDPADEVIDRIDDLQGRITAAIAVLDVTEKERRMLSMLLDEEASVPDGPADPRAAAAARQQKKRLRSAVDDLAGLTPDELMATSLLRRHHTIAAAATAAAPGLDVPGSLASAKQKVLALFGIETEIEDDLK